MQNTNTVTTLISPESAPKWWFVKFQLLGGSLILRLFQKKINPYFILFQPWRSVSWACPYSPACFTAHSKLWTRALKAFVQALNPHTGRKSWRTYPTAEPFQKNHYIPTQEAPVGGNPSASSSNLSLFTPCSTIATIPVQNVSTATQEGFLHQASSNRVQTLQILYSLPLLSATHLKFKGCWGWSQQLMEALWTFEVLQSNTAVLLARF